MNFSIFLKPGLLLCVSVITFPFVKTNLHSYITNELYAYKMQIRTELSNKSPTFTTFFKKKIDGETLFQLSYFCYNRP